MESSSPRYTLNGMDWNKVAIGLGVAVSGAILTYLSDLIPFIDYGDFTPVVVALWSVIANIARKFITDYTK